MLSLLFSFSLIFTLAISKSNLRSNENLSLEPDEYSSVDPPSITVIAKGVDWIQLSYQVDPSTESKNTVLYNLIMGGISMYSGQKSTFRLDGLDGSVCYAFQVAALINKQWTKFTNPPMKTSLYDVGLSGNENNAATQDVEDDYKIRMDYIRAHMLDKVCSINSLQETSFIHASTQSLEFVATSGEITIFGQQSSSTNCLYSKCYDEVSISSEFRSPLSGEMNLLLDDGSWISEPFSIPVKGNILEYVSPASNSKETIDLVGCRANPLSLNAAASIQRVGPAADACLELNCTYTAVPIYMCENERSQVTAENWMNSLNIASHPYNLIQKYDVLVKTGIIKSLEGKRQASLYEQPVYREPWVLSFVSTLADSNSCPHFPLLWGTSQCVDLPNIWGRDEKGLVPKYTQGASVLNNVAIMKSEGGLLTTQWGGMVTQSFTSNFHDVFSAYKSTALSNEFVRAFAFQLIYTLGVARDAFGLFHNDLLSLSASIRFMQPISPSPKARSSWCYRLGVKTDSVAPPSLDDPCKEEDEEDAATDTTSFSPSSTWCFPLTDIDNLQLRLYNYASSSLKKTQLEWWKQGFTFMNVPWGDDMVDVATIVCDILGTKVASFDPNAADFCSDAKSGAFFNNPLDALYHPYIASLIVTEFPLDYDLFSYSPIEPINTQSSSTTLSPKLKEKKASLSPVVSLPWIFKKDDESTIIQWSHPSGYDVSLPITFNLFLDGISAYSGTGHDHEIFGLDSSVCHQVYVSAFINNAFTQPSEILYLNDCTFVKEKLK